MTIEVGTNGWFVPSRLRRCVCETGFGQGPPRQAPDKINPWNALERAPGRLIGQWSGFDTTTVFALIKVGLIWAQFGPRQKSRHEAGF
jgi:hypothetical protein